MDKQEKVTKVVKGWWECKNSSSQEYKVSLHVADSLSKYPKFVDNLSSFIASAVVIVACPWVSWSTLPSRLFRIF